MKTFFEKRTRARPVWAALFLLCLCLIGLSGSASAQTYKPTTVITNCPDALTYGSTKQLVTYTTNAQATPAGTWSVVVGGGTISASGLYTAPASGAGESVVVQFAPADSDIPPHRVAFAVCSSIRDVFADSIPGVVLDSNVTSGGGTDSTTALQAFLDGPNKGTQNSYLRITFDGSGQHGTGVLLATQVDLPSYTNLRFVNNAGWYGKAHATPAEQRPRLWNKNKRGPPSRQAPDAASNVDKHCGISGDGTGEINLAMSGYEPANSNNGWQDGIGFYGAYAAFVDHVKVTHFRKFSVHYAYTSYFRVQDCQIKQVVIANNGDCPHAEGPCAWATGYNNLLQGGDDYFPFTANEPDISQYGPYSQISDVPTTSEIYGFYQPWMPRYGEGGGGPITNCFVVKNSTLGSTRYGIRLLSLAPDCPIERMFFDENVINTEGYTLNCDCYNVTRCGIIGKVRLKRTTGSAFYPVDNGYRNAVFVWTNNLSDVLVEDFVMDVGAKPLFEAYAASAGSTTNLVLDGARLSVHDTNYYNTFLYAADGTYTLKNCVIKRAAGLPLSPLPLLSSRSDGMAVTHNFYNCIVDGYPTLAAHLQGASVPILIGGDGLVLRNSGGFLPQSMNTKPGDSYTLVNVTTSNPGKSLLHESTFDGTAGSALSSYVPNTGSAWEVLTGSPTLAAGGKLSAGTQVSSRSKARINVPSGGETLLETVEATSPGAGLGLLTSVVSGSSYYSTYLFYDTSATIFSGSQGAQFAGWVGVDPSFSGAGAQLQGASVLNTAQTFQVLSLPTLQAFYLGGDCGFKPLSVLTGGMDYVGLDFYSTGAVVDAVRVYKRVTPVAPVLSSLTVTVGVKNAQGLVPLIASANSAEISLGDVAWTTSAGALSATTGGVTFLDVSGIAPGSTITITATLSGVTGPGIYTIPSLLNFVRGKNPSRATSRPVTRGSGRGL